MSSVNLLPWREQARNRLRQRYLWLLCIICISSLIAVSLADAAAYSRISVQRDLNKTLQNKLEQQVADITASAHVARQHHILQQHLADAELLYFNRNQTLRILTEVAQLMPDNLYLDALEFRQQQLLLNGQSFHHAAIAEFLQRAELSELFSLVQPEVIYNTDKSGGMVNRFRIRLAVVTADTSENGIVSP